jgi:hypothetical protein
VLTGVLIVGLGLAACGSSSPNASSPSTSPAATTSASNSAASTAPSGNGTAAAKIGTLSSQVQSAEKATFKAEYTVNNSGQTEMVTIEQAPPKSVFAVQSGSVIDTGTATYFCTTTGTATCISEGASNPLAALVAVFSPATVLNALKSAQAQTEEHVAGYNVTFSSASYGGQDTTCANISGAGQLVKYCVTKQGILAYASSGGGTFTLTSYSDSPAASDFALPAGATVQSTP